MGKAGTRRVDAAADTAALVGFRAGFYGCLTGWVDALFELTDAALAAPTPVVSVPALSLEPAFRRSHGSLYKALGDGEIDAERLRDLLVEYRPPNWPAVFAVDASSWPRCDAETSPERGFYYHPSRHSAGQPIVTGWSYQWITQLDWVSDSWTAPVDARRIPPAADTTQMTVTQIRDLGDRLGADASTPVFGFDAGFDPIALTDALPDVRAQVLVRIRSDRVFYQDPPARTDGTVGRPRRHGKRFACADPTTWGAPDATLTICDPHYGRVEVTAWHRLHPKLAGRGRWADHQRPPIVTGTVIRVQVEHLPKPTSRTGKTLWLWWSGPGAPNLDTCWRAYLRRFDIEHTYRFAKNTLGWTAPALRTPEQADRWTWLVVTGYTNSGSPAASSTTYACRGNDLATAANSPPPASAEDFSDFARHWAHQPVHRNPRPRARAARKAPAVAFAPAIQQSRKPPNEV